MLAVFRNQRLMKLLLLFIIAFGIVLLLIYSIVPAAPNVKLILNASQLEHHSLFVVPPGSLQIDFYMPYYFIGLCNNQHRQVFPCKA